jgi:hypothetical protein
MRKFKVNVCKMVPEFMLRESLTVEVADDEGEQEAIDKFEELKERELRKFSQGCDAEIVASEVIYE